MPGRPKLASQSRRPVRHRDENAFHQAAKKSKAASESSSGGQKLASIGANLTSAMGAASAAPLYQSQEAFVCHPVFGMAF